MWYGGHPRITREYTRMKSENSKRSRLWQTGPLAFAVTLWMGGAVMAAEPVWPAPAKVAMPSQQPQTQPNLWMPRERLTTPGFQAPSASHCNTDPVLNELPGERAPQQVAEMRKPAASGKHHRAMAEPRLTDMVPPPSPPAPPAPVAAAPASADALVVTGSRVAESTMTLAPERHQVPGPVTAGVVDDNADFGEFLQFLQRHDEVKGLGRDVSVRHKLQVRDAQGRPVPDAEVAVSAANGARFWGRTDAGGQLWLHPNAFDSADSASYRVDVRRDGRQAKATLRRDQKHALDVVLPAMPSERAKLDLVFMVDATGSMGDEIDKLRGSLQDIVRQIGQLPSSPDICLGLVTYRDKTDEYLLRSWSMTGNVDAFQGVLDKVRAGGGGDYPEAMNEAFDHAVQRLAWRGSGTTRLLLTLADAPPHLDYGKPRYQDTINAAVGKGIKVLSVAASGQDRRGEAVQRQMAQYTSGRFIFLTYKDAENPRSGAGTETSHDVANYSVDTLDQLVVRLVREELAKLPSASRG
jgi:Mg-chelatase subunit ChlD